MNKGGTVKYAKPENAMEAAQRFTLLDETDGLSAESSVQIQQLETGLPLPIIATVHLEDIVPA